MCELLGMCFAEPIVADFSIHAFSMRDEENWHGWGLAWYPDRSLAIAKEPRTWRQSAYASFLQSYAHLRSSIYIGHVRRKTVGGPPTRADTHPFMRELGGRDICFAHNGTIYGFAEHLELRRYRPVGDTDSEHVFCHIVGCLDAGAGTNGEMGGSDVALARPAEWLRLHERFAAINELGKLNCLLSDGRRLFCYHDANGFKGLCFCSMPIGYHRAEHLDDETIMRVDIEAEQPSEGVIIATRPLTDNGGWQRMEPGAMLVVESGCVVYHQRIEAASRLERRG